MKKPEEKKSLMTIALCMGILAPAAFLFSLAADLPHILVTTLGGMCLSLVTRKAFKLTDRTIIYSVVISLSATVLFDLAFPMADDRFEYLSSLFNLNITVPVIFYLAVAVTFFGIRKYSYAVSSVAAVIALAFGCNVMRVPFQTERFLISGAILDNFRALYISCICISGFFILLACRNNVQVRISRGMRKYSLRRFLITICYGHKIQLDFKFALNFSPIFDNISENFSSFKRL